MVNLTIDGKNITVEEGTTILHAAETAGIRIPTLCYHKRLNPLESCRMCVVEADGFANPMTACSTPVMEGIRVCTNSERLQRIRKENLKLILVNHPLDCPVCDKGGECTLQDLVYEFGIASAEYNAEKKERTSLYATPFIRYWPDRCIMCLRCVAACRDIKALGAIDVTGAGFGAQISPVNEEKCESCGECIRLCPTGALTENLSRYKGRTWMTNRIKTTCTYCGCGCQLELNVTNNRIVGITTKDDTGTNRGSLCVKGRFGYEFIDSGERLTKPLIKRNGVFHETGWDEALSFVAERLTAIKAANGPDAIAGISSTRCTNEEIYLLQKFMRAVIGTNNIDNPARFCHSSTLAGLTAAFGSGAMTNSISDVLKSKTILVTGNKITETHPIFANYIKEAVLQKGTNLIVVNPQRVDLVEYATLWLNQKAGTDVALINGLIHIIIRDNLHAPEYIKERTENFNALEAAVRKYTPNYVSDITGIPLADLETAARMYAQAKPASILYSMEAPLYTGGTDRVKALANLAMVCGNVGIEGGGVNPFSGENNIQGACDMGALPDAFPDYQEITDNASREKFANFWGVSLPVKPGLTFVEALQSANEGKIKGMYIMGENLMPSGQFFPHMEEALKKLDFLLVQDIFLTETAKLAHVVLPSVSFAEKDGTFTNSERMVQRIRKALSAPGEAKPDWKIIADLSGRLGYPMNYADPEQIMEEINRVIPSYGGITYRRIEESGIQWPCPSPDHPGTKFLHKGSFMRGLGLFNPLEYISTTEAADEEYPLILITGYAPYIHHTVTTHLDRMIKERYPSLVEINPQDAEKFRIENGNYVMVSSRYGKVKAKAQVTERSPSGSVCLHFHEAAANLLMNPILDPVSKIPEHEVCTVRVDAV